jgi:hypothetical protein
VPFIEDAMGENPRFTLDDLSNGLKTALNSAYGLTYAAFTNPFRDPRNKDNIVAKRGALFMIDLQFAVREKGFDVIHIKTDSIKIPNATPEIINFVMEFGKKYGYDFEHESTYSKMCLVNDAVYIAKYATAEACKEMYGYVPKNCKKYSGEWTATGAQFAQPYVFKTLFSHEKLEFKDLCETKSVTTALYLDMDEDLGKDEHSYHFIGKAGSFCPIKPGCGGGTLLAKREEKYSAAVGSKGFRWLEAEMVDTLGKQDDIDISYYENLADKAVRAISKYGDFDWFISNAARFHTSDGRPSCLMGCGKDDCQGCSHWKHTITGPGETLVCEAGHDCLPF